jgi:CRP-like cAMP-binding protein
MATSPVLAELSGDERRRLLERSVARSLGRGEVLHIAGDPHDRVHLVARGVLKLSLANAAGDETILGLAVSGSFVGDIAATDAGVQPLDAIAVTPAEVVGMDAELFVEIVYRNPRAARALACAAAARSRWMIETVLERTSGEVGERLAGRLLDLAHMLGHDNGRWIELELPIGQRDLGKLAGVCRESTCKTLRRMKAAGVLDYEGRSLRILRPDTLRMMRCGGAGY